MVNNVYIEKIRELEILAERIKRNLSERKKPFVIEFAGCPKAGKTTCVEALRKFFKRNGFKVQLISEMAEVCPLRDKRNFLFNIWTFSNMLSNLIESLDSDFEVVIVDRGIFDSLVWINWFYQNGGISKSDYRRIMSYILLDKWAGNIDVIVSLSTDPITSLEREFKDQITMKKGEIMNETVLQSFVTILQKCEEDYETRFKKIIKLNTTTLKPIESVTTSARQVLIIGDELIDEKVATIPAELAYKIVPINGIISGKSNIKSHLKIIYDNIEYTKRSDAEKDNSKVQIISAITIEYLEEILTTIVREPSIKSNLHRKRTIWIGGHCRHKDSKRTSDPFRRCALRELEEEIKFNPEHLQISKIPVAIIRDTSTEHSKKHLAIIYKGNISNEKKRIALHQREFYEGMFKSLYSEFIRKDDMKLFKDEFENWSNIYLHHFYNIQMPPPNMQRDLISYFIR